MSGEIENAIAALEAEVEGAERAFRDAERNVYGKRIALNTLLAVAGKPPRYPTDGGSADARSENNSAKATPKEEKPAPGAGISIRSDSFYGKRQQTAVREYLEMRKAAGKSAATPREIFDALREGGYQFEAKDDQVALIGLRGLLRKRSAYFHKLPNGAYGLTEWYPDAKKPKPSAAVAHDDAEDDLDTTDNEADEEPGAAVA